MKGVCYFDGGSRGNPGTAGCACVLIIDQDPDNVIEVTKLLDEDDTNNVAEYEGLLLGMRMALALGVTDIQMVSDSKLVVEQVLGKWKCNVAKLKLMIDQARYLGNSFDHIEIIHVRRNRNKHADRLVTELLDDVTGRVRK
jgi:ribonuclease H / adenosylcobalamin/alpha-ribazole phosphatase